MFTQFYVNSFFVQETSAYNNVTYLVGISYNLEKMTKI